MKKSSLLRVVAIAATISLAPVTLITVNTANAATHTAVAGESPIEIQDKVLEYVQMNEDTKEMRFNVEHAIADGASREVIDAGKIFNDYAVDFEEKDSRYNPFRYGKWCGLGRSGPGAPIDILDRACMHHDKCYGRHGYFKCFCDENLINEANRIYYRLNKEQKDFTNGMLAWFKAQRKWCNK